MSAPSTGEVADQAAGHEELRDVLAYLEHLVVTDPPEAVAVARAAIDRLHDAGTPAEQIRLRRMLAMAYSHTSRFAG